LSGCVDLEDAAREPGKTANGFSAELLAAMQRYARPCNVRKLSNEVLRMLAISPTAVLGAELLCSEILSTQSGEAAGRADGTTSQDVCMSAPEHGTLKPRIEALERQVLHETLCRHGWNKSRAAENLGLSRVGLRSKLRRHGLGTGAE
jgi:two-component system response regulator HupR/HoxA